MIAGKAAVWYSWETLRHIDIEAVRSDDAVQNLPDWVPLVGNVVHEAIYQLDESLAADFPSALPHAIR